MDYSPRRNTIAARAASEALAESLTANAHEVDRSIAIELIAVEKAASEKAVPHSLCFNHQPEFPENGLLKNDFPENDFPENDFPENDLIEALARKLIERVANGPELESHCHRLSVFVSLLGMELGLSEDELYSLRHGAYLHDIGKIGIPASILLKRGPLDELEWRVMQEHPVIGEQICSELPSLRAILPIVRSHHERWDGSGYPDGLRGEEIPLLARITQIGDIYDALTTERSYKRAFTPKEALDIIKAEGEQGWRDPKLVSAIENLFPIFASLPPDLTPLFSLHALEEVVRRRCWV